MGSAISASREALYGLLVAAPYPASPIPDRTVQVTFGPPAAHEGPEVVALLGVQNPDEEPRQLGNLAKDETFILEVGIKVYDRAPAGADEAAQAMVVDARGFAIADVVRGVVAGRTKLTLGGVPDLYWCLVISQTTDGVQPAEGGGWVIFLRILFECKARITGP